MRAALVPVFKESDMKFSELARAFVQHLDRKGYSSQTCSLLRHDPPAVPRVARRRTETRRDRELQCRQCRAFCEYLSARGMKASSVCLKMSVLSSLARYGMKRKDERTGNWLLSDNPVLRVELPRKQRPQEKYLLPHELRAMLQAARASWERVPLALLIDTACRGGGLANARVRDLQQRGERLVLHVRRKGGRHDEIVLGVEVAAKLVEDLKFREAGPDDPLCINVSGNRIKVRSHVIRHSVLTLAVEGGIDLTTTAGMAGHSGTGTISRYLHARASRVDEARDAVRRLL